MDLFTLSLPFGWFASLYVVDSEESFDILYIGFGSADCGCCSSFQVRVMNIGFEVGIESRRHEEEVNHV